MCKYLTIMCITKKLKYDSSLAYLYQINCIFNRSAFSRYLPLISLIKDLFSGSRMLGAVYRRSMFVPLVGL